MWADNPVADGEGTWLAKTFLGSEERLDDHTLSITGIGFHPSMLEK